MTSEEQKVAKTDEESNSVLIQRLGQLTRMLRVNIRGLGQQQEMEDAAKSIPDAMARLDYVVMMTEKAAQRVLNAVDRAQPLQDDIQDGANRLNQRWAGWLKNPSDLEEARSLALETQSYLEQVPAKTKATGRELLEITMAQDFQDLTGQVIKKMAGVMQNVEHQLLSILVESVSDEKDRDEFRSKLTEERPNDTKKETTLLNGPQIDTSSAEVVSSQDQVDDLLDDLGF
ncbi:MAG: protein phosphatase CheZ [Porticoccus sp.]|nr:protein phosphatase CheZ [Porticoccus sp.]MBQ0808100.1 protein phosphatase CheZ [Porticoccus sp.]